MPITPDEISRVKRFDQRSDRFYLDATKNLAIGYGHIVPDYSSFSSLPLIKKTGGSSVSTEEKEKAWHQVQQLKKSADKIGSDIPADFLEIRREEIERLLVSDLDLAEKQLALHIPGYLSYPQPAKAALVDMAYVLGSKAFLESYSDLIGETTKGKWMAASQKCNIPGSASQRNTEIKQLFEQAMRPAPTYVPFPLGVPVVKKGISTHSIQNNSGMQKAKEAVKPTVNKPAAPISGGKPPVKVSVPATGAQKTANGPAVAKQSFTGSTGTGKQSLGQTGKPGHQTGTLPHSPCTGTNKMSRGANFGSFFNQEYYCCNPGIVAIVAISANVTETAIAAMLSMSDRKR